MRVQSFIRHGFELKRVDVELSLLPGLPQISFLGLPDAALKESLLRIRSAIREQGFAMPQAYQVIVQIWPTHLRKSSRGLDLAVAAALLWETGQLPAPQEGEIPVLYGELSLKGRVMQPDDLEDLPAEQAAGVLTGTGSTQVDFETAQISELKLLAEPVRQPPSVCGPKLKRPVCLIREVARPAGELAEIIAAGELPALFAGPPGSGKSTLAEAIPSWIAEPSVEDFQHATRIAKLAGQTLTWRPIAQPHHSITPLAMIGGGASLWSGEITRAHTGVLILDELLELNPKVQEALREPLESGRLTIVRAGKSRSLPAEFLLLATANLCPCGKFVPRRTANRCRCGRAKRAAALAKLSGPLLDRFAFLALTDEWLASSETVRVSEISENVQRAISFRKTKRRQVIPNGRINPEVLAEQISAFEHQYLFDCRSLSKRRRSAVLRAARTLADLEECLPIERRHLERALQLCVDNHRLIEEWRD